jgi:hypothetical protein
MEYGIVIHKKSLNYGDDIQSLAASRLLPQVDHYIDREQLDTFESPDPVKTLCSGWFMEQPLNWPPGESIDPLFISMHITHNHHSDRVMVSERHRGYYRKHEPIGCRDINTMRLFQKIDVKTYHSACLTLTLQNESVNKSKSDEIILVDAIKKDLPEKYRKLCLSKLIPDSLRHKVVYLNHSHNDPDMSVSDRLKHAAQLLERYARAHLVVTSRIHCALPCVAMGTPVLFLDVGFNQLNSRNRFGGLIENFTRLDNLSFPYASNRPIDLLTRKLGLHAPRYHQQSIEFDWDNPPPNPVDIGPLRETLISTVNRFIHR